MKLFKQVTKDNPTLQSNIVSRLFYAWMFPLFKLGFRRSLQLSDLFRPPPSDDPVKVTYELSREWHKQMDKPDKSKVSLTAAIFNAFGLRYLLACQLLVIAECVLRVMQPFMVGTVVDYFSQSREDITYRDACLSTFFICISSIVIAFARNQYHGLTQVVGMNVRSALNVMVYQKVLRLSSSSFEHASVGYILNLLANDLNRFDEVAHTMYYIVVAALQLSIVIYLLWGFIGFATVGGIGVLCLFVPLQGMMGRLFRLYRRKSTGLTDRRVRLMNEVISAMRVIKMYCWEAPFGEMVKESRAAEVTMLKWSSFLKAINSAMNFIQIRVMLFATYLVYIYMYNKLDASSVFVTMSLYNALQTPVARQFPNAIGITAETLVAIKRVQQLLMMDERKPRNYADLYKSIEQPDFSIRMRKYSAKWNCKVDTTALTDLNLTVNHGELVVVVGSVGSGKTCLLNAVLNELNDVSGECLVTGDLSYAPQTAWCYAGSVRDNILLANEFDHHKFEQVIKACGLQRDLELLPDGDQTMVGEKGYTLSGGQKARICLARAVYNDSDIYLLDDPLSAVDPHVANHIFHNCINGYLHDKTVILATHQRQFLKFADKVVILDEGKLLTYGSFDKLKNCGIDLSVYLSNGDNEELSPKGRSLSKESLKQDDIEKSSNPIKTKCPEKIEHKSNGEGKSEGSVKWRVYYDYLRSGANVPTVIFVLLIVVCAQVISIMTDFWLSAWTESYEKAALSASVFNESDFENVTFIDRIEFNIEREGSNIMIYCCLIAALFVLAFARSISLFLLCLNCSKNLHDNCFKMVLRSPSSFFETNPIGRILNRFTRDVGQIDQKVPPTLIDVSSDVMSVIGVLVISMTVKPFSVIPAVILMALAIPFRNFYVKTTRDIKRLEALAKSPLYNHVATTVDGLQTVRAFGLQHTFTDQFMEYVHDSTSTRYMSVMAQRAVGITLDCFALTYVCTVCIILVAFPEQLHGSYAGLVLSSALTLIGMFQSVVRNTTEFETEMVSVERVIEYQSLGSESALTSAQGALLKNRWPKEGKMFFKNVNLKYSENSKPVLDDISLNINGGEKIGVVGRTGAGKSSLISAIFRLTEPTGSIWLDGVDISSIGLHELRSKLTIIPQDPILFSGTVRHNLDPFNQFKDDELWRCLADANLAKTVANMTGQLDGEIADSGANLSAGQRQLVCLARALLRKNKVLILDEATANVDYETDELIQTTIRTKFTDCTVLTIAHRLNTVIDMDKVLVLDAGQVREFDEPHLLLKQEGLFYDMVQKTGEQHAQLLKQMARRTFLDRHARRDTLNNLS